MSYPSIIPFDLLTTEEVRKAYELKEAKLIHDQIILPNWDRINKSIAEKTGQAENDPMYISYAIEYAVTVRF